MFNDKTTQKKNKAGIVLTSAAVLAMSATFGYSAIANDQIQAFVSKPALRTEYKSSDMIDLAGAIDLRNGNQKISVSLRNSDLKAALRMIADKAGLNIIFHNSVSGNVTLDLVDVSLNDAFKMIMQACELSYVIDNGTLLVLSKSASLTSDVSKQNMMSIPVKYADATKIADFLNSNVFTTNRPGLSNSKIVVTNAATNELLLFGTVNDYKMAQKVVSKLDVAPRTISYRINHTTPQEMATLICQSLFPSAGGSSDSASGNASEGASTEEGTMTGGAFMLGGDSEGGDSGATSDASGSSGSSGGIVLGEGKVACSIKGDVSGGTLKSLTGTSLTVTYFPQKGSINITGGSEHQAEMIRQFILANDKKQPQAYVEIQVIDLNEEGSREFNNTWNVKTPFFTANFDPTGRTKTTNPMFVTGGSSSGLGDRYHGDKTLAWTIDYLIQNKKARMLANPKVVVTNGKTSVINLTEDYVKEISEEIMTAGSYGTAGTSRDYDIQSDKGIMIELTPFISPDGYVTMNLKPSYSTIAGEELSVSSVGGTPIRAATLLKRRNLDLANIRVKDGETLVLGGMIQEEENKIITKVPFLGDLPVIGPVFRNTKNVSTKSELVLMVTPRIIVDTEDSTTGSENL